MQKINLGSYRKKYGEFHYKPRVGKVLLPIYYSKSKSHKRKDLVYLHAWKFYRKNNLRSKTVTNGGKIIAIYITKKRPRFPKNF